MLAKEDLDNKVFDYIYPWSDTLSSILWVKRASYHRTIQVTPGQIVLRINMIFKITSVIDWKAINTGKQQQVDIDNVQEKS